MKLIVDSREQLPLWRRGVIRKALLAGDYTTDKLQDTFAFERKSPMDLYGSITRGHVRFRNEMIRAMFNEMKLVIIIECSKKDFICKNFRGAHRLKLSGAHLEKIINTIEKRYKMEVIWCCSREKMKKIITERFNKEENKIRRKKILPDHTNDKANTRTPLQKNRKYRN